MKTAFILAGGLVSLLMLSACNTTVVDQTIVVNGVTNHVHVANSRFLWKTEGYKATPTTNGYYSIDCKGSGTDADSIKAAAQGAAEGTARGLGVAK